jgi:hypothetical protein
MVSLLLIADFLTVSEFHTDSGDPIVSCAAVILNVNGVPVAIASLHAVAGFTALLASLLSWRPYGGPVDALILAVVCCSCHCCAVAYLTSVNCVLVVDGLPAIDGVPSVIGVPAIPNRLFFFLLTGQQVRATIGLLDIRQ